MKIILFRAAVILVVLTPGFGRSALSAGMDSIVIAHAQFESTALLCIAEDQNFFSRNKLKVISHKLDTGVGALDEITTGRADIAVGTAEFPLVGRVFQKEKIRVIGSIARSELIYLLGRKDRGIEKVSDLKGKRIGTTFRTIAHFYLGRFLELNAMNMQDITLVDLKTAAEWVNAVVNGDIDAVATAQPYAESVRNRLGANAAVWSAQSSQPLYALAIAADEWIRKHPEQVNSFLGSLAQAEDYAIRNPAKAKAIVRQRLNLDAAYVATVWSQNQFSLSLDQSLIVAMDDKEQPDK